MLEFLLKTRKVVQFLFTNKAFFYYLKDCLYNYQCIMIDTKL